MSTEVFQEVRKPSYFLVSVSTRENLDLCIEYGLAGFPGGENGAWTFCEIAGGDMVSFLYGARAHNLYRVAKKEALRDAQLLPPWEPLVFQETGRTYSFPFRLQLQPIRAFSEALVRAEFAYVAENLLLRGGYSKTHFQADQTTLQSASQMGVLDEARAKTLALGKSSTFEPRFTRNKDLLNSPEVTRFKETILQSAIRNHLKSATTLQLLLNQLEFSQIPAADLEVLGEKAIPNGHIDILLKSRAPLGSDIKIPIEVKTQKAQPEDLDQLIRYTDELRGECAMGVLLAHDFHKKVIARAAGTSVKLVRYELTADLKGMATFDEIHRGLTLHVSGVQPD